MRRGRGRDVKPRRLRQDQHDVRGIPLDRLPSPPVAPRFRSGRALRGQGSGHAPSVHGNDHRHARARHRRQCRDLQRGECRDFPAASLCRAQTAGADARLQPPAFAGRWRKQSRRVPLSEQVVRRARRLRSLGALHALAHGRGTAHGRPSRAGLFSDARHTSAPRAHVRPRR